MKSSTLIWLALFAIFAASLVFANRDNVTFRLVPYVQDDSAFTVVTPLYILVFSAFLLGLVLGAGTIGWRQYRKARKMRRAAKEAEKRLALEAAKTRVERPQT
ncbi:MAG TPA: LapA family protein [Micropepsaceae bacterium]|jgi:uncharacterized integral membrane protein|nr:LapA family protein [Micropepsaceae bacterium]